MKIVRRVSLYRAVERTGEPTRVSSKLSRYYYEQTAEWKMPVDYELFKYGYRNRPKTYLMAFLGICAYLVGITWHSTELELRNVPHLQCRTKSGPFTVTA